MALTIEALGEPASGFRLRAKNLKGERNDE